MITVAMLAKILKDAKEILLCWNGFCRTFDAKDTLDVDAFGSYVVCKLTCVGDYCYELQIACTPVKNSVRE